MTPAPRLAEAVAGSEGGLCGAANERAAELGIDQHPHFKTAPGLMREGAFDPLACDVADYVPSAFIKHTLIE